MGRKLQYSALVALLIGLYWTLYKFQIGPWVLETLFLSIALVLWLGRKNPAFRAAAILIPILLLALHLKSSLAVIIVSTVFIALGGWTLSWSVGPDVKEKRATLPIKIFRTVGLLTVLIVLAFQVVGPIVMTLNPAQRWNKLTQAASVLPPLAHREYSPEAKRLMEHVVHLSEKVGERAAYQEKNRNKARDYVASQFKALGLEPTLLAYTSQNLYYVKDDTTFHNIEAILQKGKNPEKGVLLVSAHYDTAPGTKGADDNASGTAVMLELARAFKNDPPLCEIRFLAFGTEEPPAFGTQNMGSFHYAQQLKEQRVDVQGLVNLEMVGYFNPRRGSQLYPPFLHLFFPDHGNFIAIVSNFASRKFLKRLKSACETPKNFSIVSAVLPSAFSGVTLSDQLNFWTFGFNAVMVTDTSFFRNPHYHENSDTAEKLDYEKMAELTTTLSNGIHRMTE